MKTIKLSKVPIGYSPDLPVKVQRMGNMVRIICSTSDPNPSIVNIDKDHYEVKATGEVKEKVHKDKRIDNIESLKRTFAATRDLIYCNVTSPQKMKWITFTYRPLENGKPMTDPERLSRDWDVFFKRFKRYCKRKGIEEPTYITVAEPQGSGAWHLHTILIYQNKAPFIPNDDMESMWGQGFVKTKRVKNAKNIAAYFTAYLTDLPVDEFLASDMSVTYCTDIVKKEVTDERTGKTETKAMMKGGRLGFYPTGFNFVRHSKGLKTPEESIIRNEEADEIRKGGKLIYRSDIEVWDDTRIVNRVSKELYRDVEETADEKGVLK